MDGYPPTLISTRYTDTLNNKIQQEKKMRKKQYVEPELELGPVFIQFLGLF
jgi:hypothetical protein